MGLDELRRIIAQSDREDWNVISCFGALQSWMSSGSSYSTICAAAS